MKTKLTINDFHVGDLVKFAPGEHHRLEDRIFYVVRVDKFVSIKPLYLKQNDPDWAKTSSGGGWYPDQLEKF